MQTVMRSADFSERARALLPLSLAARIPPATLPAVPMTVRDASAKLHSTKLPAGCKTQPRSQNPPCGPCTLQCQII